MNDYLSLLLWANKKFFVLNRRNWLIKEKKITLFGRAMASSEQMAFAYSHSLFFCGFFTYHQQEPRDFDSLLHSVGWQQNTQVFLEAVREYQALPCEVGVGERGQILCCVPIQPPCPWETHHLLLQSFLKGRWASKLHSWIVDQLHWGHLHCCYCDVCRNMNHGTIMLRSFCFFPELVSQDQNTALMMMGYCVVQQVCSHLQTVLDDQVSPWTEKRAGLSPTSPNVEWGHAV